MCFFVFVFFKDFTEEVEAENKICSQQGSKHDTEDTEDFSCINLLLKLLANNC